MNRKLFTDMVVTPEDEAIVKRVTRQTLTITIDLGNALVIEDVLKQAAVAIARDGVELVAEGDMEEAEALALVGMEVVATIDKLKEAIRAVEGSDELTRIAKRSARSAKLNARAEKLKGTLQ